MSEKEYTTEVEYRSIPGFPGYRVGSDGSVWTCKNARWGFRSSWRQMKLYPQKPSGHLNVSLSNGKRRVLRRVHRLVLEAFVGPCPTGHECRHLDGQPGNNCACNLCWGSRKQNMQDRIDHGVIVSGSGNPRAVLNDQLVLELRTRAAGGEHAIDLALEYAFKIATVRAAIVGRTWKYHPTPTVALPFNRWKRRR